jgi:hypothetical protein
MASPMASPAASAPRIIGTGFSRRNNSVRSRVKLLLPLICSRRRGGGSKTLGGRRRRFRRDAFCSAPRGSSFTKSSSIGSIINWFATARPIALFQSVYSSSAQKQLFVDRKNLARDQDEDHLVDLVSRAKKISRGSQSNLSRFRNGIAICAAPDRRKRDGFDFVLGSEAQRVPITVGQRLCFTAVPSRPDRTDGMNDEGCGQIVAARNFA